MIVAWLLLELCARCKILYANVFPCLLKSDAETTTGCEFQVDVDKFWCDDQLAGQ